jgi:nitroimidazol reductase NimA-like FMN-containing flavoprotein (pyridoxamine 5'-phosphate oxidase superfamily)
MASGSMTVAEREEFLGGVHVAVLSVERPGRGPLAVPVWYAYIDGVVEINLGGSSLKTRLLRAAGRATVTVQTETAPYKYVSVEGPVTIQPIERDNLEMAARYLDADLYAWYAKNNPRSVDTVVARLTPEAWNTIDYGKLIR